VDQHTRVAGLADFLPSTLSTLLIVITVLHSTDNSDAQTIAQTIHSDQVERELLADQAPVRPFRAMTGRARSPLRHKLADGPSADMAPRPDFEKVLILRDMELGQTG
jgi:hypothetical protein